MLPIRHSLRHLLAVVAWGACLGPAAAADFTAGNVVVYRVGTGSGALSSAGTAVILDEYRPDGSFVQSVALPSATVGSNHRLVASGSAGSEGQLTRTANGRYLVATGYDAALTAAGLSGSASATTPRVIGLIDVHGTIDTSTDLTDAASGNNPRSATGDGVGTLWFAGAAGGLRATTPGATTSTLLNATANVTTAEIFAGQLWVSSAKNGFIASVGSGLPTNAGQTFTNLPLGAVTPNAFVLLQLGHGPFPDTIYEAENTASIKKYSLVAGSFVANGSFALAGASGLTASVNGSTVTLYATNGSALTIITDSTGYNATPAFTVVGTPTLAATNTAFRGVAFAPATPPTIAPISDRTTAENTGSAIGLAVASPIPSAALTLTATSSNPALVAPAGLGFATNGSGQTLTIAPVSGAVGTSTIQVTVSDSVTALTATTSFALTIQDTAPTILAVADQAIFHDTATLAIPVTIGDAETPATALLLSATSSNQTLLPPAGIALGVAGAARTVTLTPAAGQAGVTTVTLVVGDLQGLTASTSFALTVSNGTADTAPTISTVPDQHLAENGTSPALAVTVADQETPAANLVLTASATSNPALLPLSAVAIVGTGAQRTVVLAPVPGQVGTAAITLTVDDTQGLTTSTTFQVTVADTAPTISQVPPQSLLTGTTSAPLPVAVGDAETQPPLLVLTAASSNPALLPASAITLSGAGAARLVTLAPAPGQNGTSTITLTVDDGQGLTASTSFVLTVASDRAPLAGAHALSAVGDRITVVPASQFTALDSDPDGDAVLMTAVSGTTAQGGTVALVDGKVIYTPPAGFHGTDSFTYTLRDGVRVSAPIPSLGFLGWDDVAHTVPVEHSGWGSSLAPVPGTTNEYYLLADRGPNGDTSVLPAGSPAAGDPLAVVFPDPGYDPEIAHVRWNADGSMELLGTLPIRDENGAPLSGRPNPSDATNGFQRLDMPYDINGDPEALDPKGLDSEGLVALADGTFWVSDEYGPWLLHLDAHGTTLERLSPFALDAAGHKLPRVLAHRLQNKGMEGLTVTPDGALLVAMMQSALQNDPVNDADGSKNKKNLMTRLLTYRLVASATEEVGTVHQYAYLLGDPTTATASSNKQALSEITAISNTDILVDERDGNFPSDPGGAVKRSWVCHLPSGLPGDATPIDDAADSAAGLSFGGKSLETLVYNQNPPAARATLASHGLIVLPKDASPLVDLGLVGAAYDHDKVEGILAVGGKVLYSNDDDFGINGSLAKVITGSYPVGSYPLGTAGGLVTDYEQMLEVDPTKLLAATGTVTVTVSADTAPTLAAIPGQTTTENTPTGPIVVTVGDAETPAFNLTLSATSSNPGLVANAAIVLGGMGVNRTVTITPAANQLGTATITLTVDDGQGMTGTTTFLLSVLDNAPVANPDTLTALQNGKLVVASSVLSANDSDADGDALTVTGVSPASSQGGSVALVDGKVIYTPRSGFLGTDTFTYTIRDGVRVSGKIPTGAPLGFADVAHTVPVNHSGYGSSLSAVPGAPGEYYLMTDRGPNGDNSGITSGAALTDPNAKTFPIPAFDPEIAHVRWNSDGSVSVLGIIPFLDSAGAPLTGLPNHLDNPSDPNNQIIDVGYDILGNALAPDPNGIDCEGLAAMPDGSFWVSDEYGPWLIHFDATGRTIERIGPYAANAQGHKLPAVLAKRLTNKGMEGLTVTPDGSLLVGMMQSALVNDPVNDPVGNPYVSGSVNTYGKNNKKNLLLRVITYRLAGGSEAVGTVHQYGYLLGDPTAQAPAATGNKQAISEITALSNTDILIDERDGNFPSDVGGSVKKSWVFHLPSGIASDATPLDDANDGATGLLVAGATTLETLVYNKRGIDAAAALAAVGLRPLAKDPAPLVDLSLVGLAYTHDKVEGILAQNGKILYSNDDDFGLNGSIVKTIPGSYPTGNLLGTASGGRTTDYSQLLEVDPRRLLPATGTVTVMVVPDAPPTISAVPNQSTPAGTPLAIIPVTIGDAETPASSLELIATSSNPALLPSAGIALGGAGANRTLVLTPADGQVGTSTISLAVDDLTGKVTTTSFTLTVSAVAQTVTFSALADRRYDLSGADLVASASSALPVTFAVVSGPATVVNGAHPQVFVTDIGHVVLSATQAGTATIAQATSQQGFTVLVNPVLTGGPSYPPPGATFTYTSGATSAGAPQGVINTYTNMAGTVAANQPLFWGPATAGVAASLTGDPTEILAFDPADSDLPNGVAVWAGNSSLQGANGPLPVLTRCTVQVSGIGGSPALPWSAADGYGFSDPSMGAIVQIAGDYQVHIQFEAAVPGGAYAPLDSFYDATPHTGSGGALTSFSGAFFFPIATPVLAWSQPAGVDPGTQLGAAQLDPTATYAGVPVAGTFQFTPPAGTVVGNTSQALSATFTPADSFAFTNGGTVATTLLVHAQQPQTLTFAPIGAQTFGALPVTLSASATSGLLPVFSVLSGPASVSGSTLTILGAGSVVIAADQSGNALYLAAARVTQTISVAKASQTLTVAPIGNQTFSLAPLSLGASATSGLTPVFTVLSGPATVNGSSLTLTGVGTVTVAADQGGNSNILAAPRVTQSFNVAKGAQTIGFSPIGGQVMGVAPITLTATATSGLPVVFAVKSGPATISGNLLTITGPGTVVVAANQVGSATWLAAPQVTQSIPVAKAPQSITFAPLISQTFGVAPLTLAATASSGLTVTFSIKSGPASISGAKLIITGAGTVVVAADQAGNAAYQAAPQVTQSIPVVKAAQTVAFNLVGDQTYGVAPLTLSATATSGLAPTFSVVSGPAKVSATTLTITGGGTVVLAANQAGNSNFLAASPVTQSLTVAPAVQTITFTTVGNQTFEVAPLTLSATSTSGLTTTFSVISGPGTVDGAKLTIIGGGTVVVAANQAGNASFLPASTVTQNIVVAPKAQTITFTAIGAKTFGTAPIVLKATTTSGLAPVFSVLSGPGNVSGSTLTFLGAGTVVVAADQAGSASYLPATQLTQSVTVAQAAQTITFATIGNQTFGVVPLTLSATTTSGLAPVFSVVSGPGSVSGSTLTFTAPGTVVVAANQIGDGNYLAAPQKTQSVVVAKTPQTIAFAPIGGQIFGVAPLTLTATATSTLPVAFSVTSGPATITGSTLTITGAGTVVVSAKQAGNVTYAAAATVSQSIVVTATDVIAIDAGGSAVANFVADTDFAGGSKVVTSSAVSTAGVANAAPVAVYQSARTAKTMTYTIPGLVAGGAYLVRLHFAEIVQTGAGQRIFSVALNGVTELANLDIVAVAGGPNVALVSSLTTSATSSGQVIIGFAATTGTALVSGIEIISISGNN